MKKKSLSIRSLVQHLFFLIVAASGVQFYLFVSCLEKGGIPGFDRPPGVEAFLPVSALVSLKHLIYTGTVNPVHPAGLVLFLMICGTALLARRGFCSWICPVGLVSEYLGRIGRFVFKKPSALPRFLDVPMRGLKYLAAGFFIYQIFFNMPVAVVEMFIYSPYNRFADIEMLWFFTRISSTALVGVTALAVLSVIFRHFWCRYLCPYGALLGVIGFLGFGRIRRNPDRCSGCGKCTKNCPGRIAVASKTRMDSPECSACLTCVEGCPEPGALAFSFFPGSRAVGPAMMAGGLILVFAFGTTWARLSGNWHNEIPVRQYLRYASPRTAPGFKGGAPRTVSPGPIDPGKIDPEKMERMVRMMRTLREHSP